jgi:predicted Fe-Mo cluster-binding NifX family protein
MKVAITSQGPKVESEIDPRFGRARYFIVVDTESGQFTTHDNQKNVDAVQGAGIQAGRTVIELGAGALITGHIGPKALDTLQAAGVEVYSGVSGTVQDAVGVFKRGGLETVDKPDVEGHWA